MDYLKHEIGKMRKTSRGLIRFLSVACSHHEDYWLIYTQHLGGLIIMLKQNEDHSKEIGTLGVRLRIRIYRRGCTTHVPYSTCLLLKWCNFEERAELFEGAHLALNLLEKAAPKFDDLALRRIYLYPRLGNYDQVAACYCNSSSMMNN